MKPVILAKNRMSVTSVRGVTRLLCVLTSSSGTSRGPTPSIPLRTRRTCINLQSGQSCPFSVPKKYIPFFNPNKLVTCHAFRPLTFMSNRGRSTSPRPLRDGDVEMGNENDPQKSDARVVVVKNLTRNVVESHLRVVFGFYGQITKIDLPVYVKCEFAL